MQNRKQRRAELRSQGLMKSRKRNAMMGLSILATSGFLGSNLQYLRPQFAYAAEQCSFAVSDATTAYEINTYIESITTCTTLTLTSATPSSAIELDTSIVLPTALGERAEGFAIQGEADKDITFTMATGIDESMMLVGDGDFAIDNLIFDGAGTGGTNVDGSAISTLDGETASTPSIVITNSVFINHEIDGLGGAIFSTGDSLIIEDSVFSDNSATDHGGAIYFIPPEAGSMSLNDVDFYRNESEQFGGAVHSRVEITTITGSKFVDNQVKELGDGVESKGGAVYVYSGGIGTVSGSTFTNNDTADTSNGTGGAIYVLAGGITSITSSSFSNNDAGDDGGAIAVELGGIGTISDTSFSTNTAGDDGGAVYVYAGGIEEISGTSAFTSNTADDHGGAVYLWTGGIESISGATFTSNTSGDNGGAAYVYSGGIGTVLDATFTGNSAEDFGGALFVYSGGIETISSTTFSENRSATEEGGAIFVAYDGIYEITNYSSFTDNYAYVHGGALAIYEGGIETISDSSFSDNTAEYGDGGAIYVDYGGIAYIYNSTFTGNYAYDDGGSIYIDVDGIGDIVDSSFTNNSTDDDGGAIFVDEDGIFLITNSSFTGNSVANDGGAVYVDNGGIFVIEDSIFTNNRGYSDGGAIYVDSDGIYQIYSSVFEGNSSGWGGAIYLDGDGVDLISRSSFVSNSATNGAGAILVESHLGLVRNSTFHNNVITGEELTSAPGDENLGNAIVVSDSNPDQLSSTFLNTTIWRDVESGTSDLFEVYMAYNQTAYSELTFLNTVVGNSLGEVAVKLSGAPFSASHSFISSVENLDGTSRATDDWGDGNLEGWNAGLADETVTSSPGIESHTPVLLPQQTSPLVNAGDPTLLSFGDQVDFVDQRGAHRIFNGAIVDIGAVESSFTPNSRVVPATPYDGPFNVTVQSPPLCSGSDFIISGEKLETVDQVLLGGTPLIFKFLEDGRISASLPDVAAGSYQLMLSVPNSALVLSQTVQVQSCPDGLASSKGKVNVGSFNGKLVVYAVGLDGAKISWKVAGKWGVAYAEGDLLNRFDRPVGAAGVNVLVDIYVNGVKQLSKTVLTR